MKKNILCATNSQKILAFISQYPHRDFMEREIERAVRISRSGTNYALRELALAGFVFRNKRGKACFYTLNHRSPLVKQLKIMKTIAGILPLYENIKDVSSKIILFGSSCRGENAVDSDIDLFVVSRSQEDVEKIVKRYPSKRKIQAVIRSNVKLNEMRQTEPDFYEQVNRGIVLWEAQGETGV